MTLKHKIALLFDDEKRNIKGDSIVEFLIAGLIVVNTIAIVLESYHDVNTEYAVFFNALELFSIIVFSIEYLIRIWIADIVYPKLSPFKAKLKYITSFMGLVDLISILPFYLPYFVKIDLRVLRTLLQNVIKKTKSEILVTIFLVFILLTLASTLMYNIEKTAQPDAFQNIGQAMWWAVATLTTVGYGDIYPVTGLGKILSAFIALLGIGIVALPTGIISSAYIEEIRSLKKKKKKRCECPHCGKEIIQ